uniref:Receptor-like serine/threonine-protein kinase n=1 Tax=Aegilops tauschii TaxID=37682 RepID=M8C0P3_AEGTA
MAWRRRHLRGGPVSSGSAVATTVAPASARSLGGSPGADADCGLHRRHLEDKRYGFLLRRVSRGGVPDLEFDGVSGVLHRSDSFNGNGFTFASGGHMLGAGSSLSVEDHERPFLVSPDATFSCGFLPAVDVDNAFYFSLWFTAATDRTAVWTANPGAPVNGRISRVSFGADGKLALADANGTTVWDSKAAGNKYFTVSLLDTGNLRVGDPSTGRAVWQSFEWPTDTLLPSQALTKDTKLVAGYYALYYDNDNVLRLLYDGPEVPSIYWPNPGISLSVFDNGRTNYNSSRIGVLDDTGVFLSSDNLRVEASDLGASGVKRRLTIEQDGNVRMYSLDAAGGWTVTWAAVKQPCSVRGLCGKNAVCEYQPFLRCSCAPGYEMVDRRDWRKGCNPTFSLPATNCSTSEQRFTFVKVAHTDFYGYDLGFNQSVTFQYCKSICLNTCSCIAFSYRTDGQGRCYPKGLLFNGYTSPAFPGSIYLKVPRGLNASAPTPSAGLDCNHNGSGAAIVPPYAHKHLFGEDIGKALAWRDRFKIALGAAKGLAYLHHECLEWVIHCDVKPENILLTRDLDPKIADFGLSKLSGRKAVADGMQLSQMRGTTGYMAPEWVLGLPIDAKVDVYSYGIVLLEILMGSRITEQTTVDRAERLQMSQIVQALKQVVANGDVMSLMDSRLNGLFNPQQAMEMLKISLSCMEERSSRPTMDDIFKALIACDDEDEHPAYLS